MSSEFTVQLEKLKGLNQLLIAYVGLLEDEKDDLKRGYRLRLSPLVRHLFGQIGVFSHP